MEVFLLKKRKLFCPFLCHVSLYSSSLSTYLDVLLVFYANFVSFCFFLVDATSGGTSGPGQAVEAKRDKIIILKGRGRVDSNVSKHRSHTTIILTVLLVWT